MKNLKFLREEHDLTQREFAQKLGISKTTLCYYEQGKVSPSTEMLVKLADFFGCSTDYLLGHQINDPTRQKEATMLQRQLCNEILALNEDDCGRVEAYIAGIKAKNKETEKLKNSIFNENTDW